MHLLFTITVCSFCAGLWVAFAIARHVRRGQLLTARQPHPQTDPTHEFFEAGEYRTPRPLRLDQEIFRQSPRRPLSAITFTSAPPAPVAANFAAAKPQLPRTHQPVPIRPATAYATLNGESVLIARINSQPQPAASDIATTGTASEPNTLHRPPTSTGAAATRLIDLTRTGQLMADPYESLLRGSGTQTPLLSSPPDRSRAISRS